MFLFIIFFVLKFFSFFYFFFFFQAEDGIRDGTVTGVQTCALPISPIGMFQDGIYDSRPAAVNREPADTARVEVMKGPQGTVFGRNTIAGAKIGRASCRERV